MFIYDTNMHVFKNSEIFESYADILDITNKQTNQLFTS